ncbi:MAG: hypothetical protein COU47_00325 [Candidatus Niyogibacteria bacterium CG10_big_fil_rev_8_21_14_0_10_46_36]|uniref:Phospho-N-acetylmuramoyl-pentapeptide-transferase n=1 Tax=Candidatus Niyogibacteria bacterium CG10_big_fil_rev_8_21_14_0_10_46_36 TaxID=1974726 RepID=A0A2H0TEA3_9BACT|nr:MAG: hypothetical protein COU47_00325 [Candidatus Niyogibacteria bacterium CG10_big_fil_rev_8_21_14_0_10_46_36]
MILNVLKVFGLTTLAFFIGILVTPILSHYLYKYKLWRKEVRQFAPDGAPTPIFARLHAERERNVPRMGGILVWGVVLFVSLVFFVLSVLFPQSWLLDKLNFVSRTQTWLPLFTLVAASLVGLADDIFQVFGRGKYIAGGIRFTRRLALIVLIAAIGAYWFYVKLDVSSLFVPFVGELSLGILFPVVFVFVMIATFSGGVIDGLDGLAAGTLAASFAALGGIAFFQNQIDIAAFTGVLVGALLAFLWFNIPPARFYLGETGMMGLSTVLTVIAFLTKSVLLLPLIAFPLVVAALSSALQLLWRRAFGRKLFLVAPIHHYFEAKGWPAHKVTMRFWVVGIVCALIGMVIVLIGKAGV